MTGECQRCSQSFIAFHGSTKYCSTHCRDRATDEKRNERRGRKVVEQECELCKRSYETANKNQKYCSVLCRERAKQKGQVSYKKPARNSDRVKSNTEIEFHATLEQGIMAACNKNWKQCAIESDKALSIADTPARKVDAQYWGLYANVQMGNSIPKTVYKQAIKSAQAEISKGSEHVTSVVDRLLCLYPHVK